MNVTSRGNIVDSGTEPSSDVKLLEPMLLTFMPPKAKGNLTGERVAFESSMEEGSLGGNVGSDSTSTGSEGAGIAPRQADRHLSKTLAYTLRHGAQKYNYDVQSDGYLFVDEILSCQPGLKGYSDEDICRVVRFDDNKRFRLSTDDITGRLKIKANHGHSIPIHDSDLVLIKQGEVTKAYHCTSMVGWDGIVGMGINKMGRVHIHFSTQVPDSLKPHWEVIVQVDIKEAQQDGYKFFRSHSGLILCSGNEEGTLPAKYISFAQHLDSGEYMNLDPSVSLHDDDESIEAEHSDLICEIGSSCNSVNEVMCVHQDTPQVSQQVKGSYDVGARESESTQSADPGKHFFDSTCKSTEWGKVGPNTEQSGNWSDSTGDGVSEIENDPPPGYREATREPGDETSGSDLDNTLVKGMQDSKGDPENEEGVVTVCRLRSGSVFRVPVKVQGRVCFAVVDTAAEVTLISEEVYKSLKVVPPVLKEVIMHTAGRGMQMNGFIVGPTEIQLGARVMEANIYVAPISDDMLLGFDLLREEGVALDMLEGHLKIGDEVIPMTSGAVGQVPREANVLLDKTVTVPPNSVMRVSCNLSNELSGYVVEACTHDELLVPRTLQAPGRHPIICLMNISDKHVTIPENEMIARAIEVEILPGTELGLAQGNDPWVCKVEGEDHSLVEEGVPNHLKDLFDKSKTDLDTDGQKQLASLLSDFGDVFAANEFDLGNFSLIEHHIDTGDHPPIKQRMRRTPVGFAQEEEAHLKRMLEAG
ncbi:2'-phosphotransferase [Mytilus galloprovincialis]|uniref:2'-phosphotransferase n=1 Tax=Mytilus galloprovincialis TaxID=29158 RepID=A0A8B6DKS4_MYTGA|nr:2'-phosphotransferase [Mytilus galloprovincialis]